MSRIKHLADSVHEILAGGFSTAPTVIRVTSTSNALTNVTLLSTKGTYRIKATCDCYFRTANTGITVATLNATPLGAWDYEDLPVTKHGPINIAVIADGSQTGYLYITRRPRTAI
jgi:hypothetical protein